MRTSELLSAIAAEADDEAAKAVADARLALDRNEATDARRLHASATALYAVSRILTRTAQKERAAEKG